VTLLSRRSAASSTAAGPNAPVVLERFPALDGVRPADAAERLRDLPGLALLESARRGRLGRWTFLTADPVAVVEAPDLGKPRLALARLDGSDPGRVGDADPPFLGGLVGYLGYGLRTVLEPRLAASAAAHPRPASRLPDLHLALHDWVVAWDEWSGAAWIGGRAVDGDAARLAARLTDARARLADARYAGQLSVDSASDSILLIDSTLPAVTPGSADHFWM